MVTLAPVSDERAGSAPGGPNVVAEKVHPDLGRRRSHLVRVRSRDRRTDQHGPPQHGPTAARATAERATAERATAERAWPGSTHGRLAHSSSCNAASLVLRRPEQPWPLLDDWGVDAFELLMGSIDRRFVANLDQSDTDRDAEIVRSTVQLGHAFGLRAVAEGVEDGGTLELAPPPGLRHRPGLLHQPTAPLPITSTCRPSSGAQRRTWRPRRPSEPAPSGTADAVLKPARRHRVQVGGRPSELLELSRRIERTETRPGAASGPGR